MNIGHPLDGRFFRNGYEFLGLYGKRDQLNLSKEEAVKVAAIADSYPNSTKNICFTKWRADGSLRCFFKEQDGKIVDADDATLRRQMKKTKEWKHWQKMGWDTFERTDIPIKIC